MLSPTRRTFLALGALAGTQLVTGCTDESDGDRQQPEDPDRAVRIRAVTATDALVASYDAVLPTAPADRADALRDLRDDLLDQRAALAQSLPAGAVPAAPASSGSTVGPGAAPSARPSSAGPVAATVADLAAAERQTAGTRLADLDAASPTLARLLAVVSAAGAAHAAALGDSGPVTAPTGAPPGSGSASPTGSAPSAATGAGGSAGAGAKAAPSPYPSAGAAGLQSALAAEHAAVYGYGVVGAFLPVGPQREDGRASYAAHQARRDVWQRMLGTSGVSPTAAAPGYRLPFQVTDAATAGQLAAHIETQLSAVYADLVGAATGPLRHEAATALRETVLRAAHWGADLPALPGLTSA